MNVLLMSLLYPDDMHDEVARRVRDKVQNQINSYQRAFDKGIRAHLSEGETLTLLNCLPVGIYPLQYRQLWLRSGLHDGQTIRQLGCLNLPWFKQKMRERGAERELLRWTQESPENRTVVLYTQYLPYMRAVSRAKQRVPDLKATVIVTDLPKDLGLPSGRKGLLRKMEYKLADESLSLFSQMDGFVLLTEPMADALGVRGKPFTVIEGLISDVEPESAAEPEEAGRDAVLYTGTLEPDLGIRDMLDAFADMPEADLWICGTGTMQQEVRTAAEKHANIRYFGFVPHEKALALQAAASALINPRQPDAAFTKYSFPSKTLEYMRSGKPVLCFPLEGIPHDYDPYLCYMEEAGSEGIRKAVRQLLSQPQEERQKRGEQARAFVLSEKNPTKQCEKLMQLLRSL